MLRLRQLACAGVQTRHILLELPLVSYSAMNVIVSEANAAAN